MRKRLRHTSSPVERLRMAIDCMPVATREAMLAGVRANERIVVGAYVDGSGGVCPMLAAHRAGARTDFLAFARSWDRFARVGGSTRVATEREVRILVAQLEASLMGPSELEFDAAIREHRALRADRMRRRGRLLAGADPSGGIVARRLRKSARAAVKLRPGTPVGVAPTPY
jgi:hypothetical protein